MEAISVFNVTGHKLSGTFTSQLYLHYFIPHLFQGHCCLPRPSVFPCLLVDTRAAQCPIGGQGGCRRGEIRVSARDVLVNIMATRSAKRTPDIIMMQISLPYPPVLFPSP